MRAGFITGITSSAIQQPLQSIWNWVDEPLLILQILWTSRKNSQPPILDAKCQLPFQQSTTTKVMIILQKASLLLLLQLYKKQNSRKRNNYISCVGFCGITPFRTALPGYPFELPCICKARGIRGHYSLVYHKKQGFSSLFVRWTCISLSFRRFLGYSRNKLWGVLSQLLRSPIAMVRRLKLFLTVVLHVFLSMLREKFRP